MVLRNVIRGVQTLCQVAIALSFCVMIAAVTIQVVGRSFVGGSPVWTEELTRFALLFLTAFGAGLAFRTGDLVNVDMFSEALPGRLRWLSRLISALATAVLCLALMKPAWTFTSIGAMQTSPALGWRMDFILVSVLILLGSLAFFSLARVVEMLTGQATGAPGPDREQ
jgi:TRAP-type C4-dicarboxylate transport system permease small subunit